ncbi:MAG: CHASE3 domain-containing protein [Verrucomicrobia bacterium]|nr:CHASE3 domain-containing protein [Verrucomicrobiota bacterium]MBV8274323.1 CHASE3 domain-containing protein [Verrucomicrobiota bacterium]
MKGSSLQYNRRVLIFVVIAIPVLIAGLFFFVSRQLRRDEGLGLEIVGRMHVAREQLFVIQDLLDQADNAQRGYLLTGQFASLLPFWLAKAELPSQLLNLRQVLAADPHQLAQVARLTTAIERNLAELSQSIDLKDKGQTNEAIASLLAAGGGSLVSEIHAVIFTMQAYENAILAERNANNDAQLNLRDDISTVLLATSTLVVVGAGILFLRIQQLQNIITVCAWTQRVNYRGKWMRMEEFLWERFRVKVSHGISEEAFDGVMGLVGKNLTIPDNRGDRTPLGGTDGPKTK